MIGNRLTSTFAIALGLGVLLFNLQVNGMTNSERLVQRFATKDNKGETSITFLPSDELNSTQRLQALIDSLSLSSGGTILLTKGLYKLMSVQARSNVHIQFLPGVIIEPANTKGRNIFECGVSGGGVRNVSFVGSNADTSTLVNFEVKHVQPELLKLRVFAINNCESFKVSNFKVIDNYTPFSTIMLGWAGVENGKALIARNGRIKNIFVENAHYGYGAIQAHAGENITFSNITSVGGVAVRLETGLIPMNKAKMGRLHNIKINKIKSIKGQAALMLQAHTMQHGSITAMDIQALGSEFAVLIAKPFVSRQRYSKEDGLSPGSFSSIFIKNVYARYSDEPIITRFVHLKYYSAALHSQISKRIKLETKRGSSQPAYTGPSIAPVAIMDTLSAKITVEDVKSEGFLYSPNVITPGNIYHGKVNVPIKP